jgi:threonine 3-dehydrogenase
LKAIVKKQRAPGLWLDDVPVPTIGDHDVLIKIRKASICGTDIHIYNWDEWSASRVPTPITIGHEFVGEIAAVGRSVQNSRQPFKVGERVCAEGHLWCGGCRCCQTEKKHVCKSTIGIGYDCDGAFAEYMRLPVQNVIRIPDEIPDDIAAFADPLGNAVHTALTYDLVGEDVLITGAGPIGMMAVAICRHVGARHVVITDINDYRLDLARKLGATAAVNVKNTNLRDVMKQLGITDGFGVGLEMSGSIDGFRQMIDVVDHGANIALLGILPELGGISWKKVVFGGLTLKGIYGREIFNTWFKMIRLLQSGLDLTPIITHRYKLEEFEKGFEAMKSGHSGKVILEI